MEILLVAQYYPPETGALAARASAHARRWAAAGADVTVLAGLPNYPTGVIAPGYRGRTFVEEVRDGVRVVRVPLVPARYRTTVHRLLNYGSYALAATVVGALGRRPDVVLATSPPLPAAAAGALLARRFGVPLVLELRDLWPEGLLALSVRGGPGALAGLRLLARVLYAAAARIVVVTPGMREALVASGVPAERLAIVANGADLEFFRPDVAPHPLRAELGLARRFVVGHFGTLGLGQDLDTFVHAVAALGARPDLHTLFVGDGARREALQTLADRIAPGRCTFVPPRPHDEVPALLAAVDLAFVSSRWAAAHARMVPAKLYEAMACGRPVLLAAHGEAAALVARAGVGRVVAPDDPAALAAALTALADDPVERARLGAAGPPYVRAHHDRARLAAELLGLLTQVVD